MTSCVCAATSRLTSKLRWRSKARPRELSWRAAVPFWEPWWADRPVSPLVRTTTNLYGKSSPSTTCVWVRGRAGRPAGGLAGQRAIPAAGSDPDRAAAGAARQTLRGRKRRPGRLELDGRGPAGGLGDGQRHVAAAGARRPAQLRHQRAPSRDLKQKDLGPELQAPKAPQIQEEQNPETSHIKEEQEEQINKSPLTDVSVKMEDDDGERRGADGLFASLDDEEHSKGDMTRHADNKRVQCSQCDKTFACKSNLTKHTRTHTGEKPFVCSICGKRYARNGHLTIHTRTHTGEKPFVCSVCGKRFAQNETLTAHTRTHTGEKPFACSVCGKMFSLKANLTKHTRTHTGEKPFACSFCAKTFSVKETLKTHTRTHTGEKHFVCFICAKRFALKESLKKHTRTHIGEKPFACSVCDKRFTVNSHLKTHTRTHTGEKPFACSVCEKRFSVKSQLKRHTRTHTGEKPFGCSACEKRFTRKELLRAHTCAADTLKKRLLVAKASL
ncbi:gastrula zinc finger protein XlCGF57.1 isoform X1 [Syngnathus scovelli]|uniref:gastrula zinc finger protein XlCGF57.1 isoform X1 n=1 Tax=Syngnathus scovelli TaxID=161590 RepID=UPI00210F4172|nr:zinc finger protein 771 isoform X1 [Syngnathus scovelli]